MKKIKTMKVDILDPGNNLLGFKQFWAKGKEGEDTYELCSGAGMGNPFLEITVTKSGKSKRYCMDMRKLMEDFAKIMK